MDIEFCENNKFIMAIFFKMMKQFSGSNILDNNKEPPMLIAELNSGAYF